MGIYYVGATSCILERFPRLIEDSSQICGASAGALMAAVLTIGFPLGEWQSLHNTPKPTGNTCEFNAVALKKQIELVVGLIVNYFRTFSNSA